MARMAWRCGMRGQLLLAAVAAVVTRLAMLSPQAMVSTRTLAAPPHATAPVSAGAHGSQVMPDIVLASIAAATAAITAGVGRSLLAGKSRTQSCRDPNCGRWQQDVRRAPVPPVPADEAQIAAVEGGVPSPTSLYELFGTDASAKDTEIKKRKYYDMQKLCHPDVAGPEGEEICILLNDAWEVLSDPEKRKDYDAQIELAKPATLAKVQEVSTDLSPMWHGPRKNLTKHHNEYTGIPLSHSRWDHVKPEDGGQRHQDEMMLFVDEWACICCRNCCDIAPQSFCIQSDNGRANVYTQWGNNEDYLDYAVQSCPVDCIYWVSREELQVLEYVTAEKMVEEKGLLPCPISYMQGMVNEAPHDPFSDAENFKAKLLEKERKKEKERNNSATTNMEIWLERMLEVFSNLPGKLRSNVLEKLNSERLGGRV
ncbi:unnamed protein product [Effrenium voratum]|nr:unnamed protein product [Effrenium voratum]